MSDEERIATLAVTLLRTAEAMHDYAVGGESEDGYLHAAEPWGSCPAAECVRVRQVLEAVGV